jgi:mono/diheme cytochrome c family protein
MRTAAVSVAIIAVLIVVGGIALTSMNGLSTRSQPSAVEGVLARLARRWTIPRGARSTVNPIPFSAETWADARAHFADHCASCHANDGSGRTTIGQNLYPKAPDMRLPPTQQLSDGELYWTIANGVRLTGMPAFGSGADDTDTWKLVHFIRRLNQLSPEQLKDMEALNPRSPAEIEEERADQQFLAGQDDDKEEKK